MTPASQEIVHPTDLGLLNKFREITEKIINGLHAANQSGKKPRIHRKIARKAGLKVAQNKKSQENNPQMDQISASIPRKKL